MLNGLGIIGYRPSGNKGGRTRGSKEVKVKQGKVRGNVKSAPARMQILEIEIENKKNIAS